MASNPPPDAGTDPGPPEIETIPSPPADLARRELPLVRLADRAPELYRSHRLDRPYSPVAFNARPIADRFNAPSGEYGVLYLAADPYAAFIETFGATTRYASHLTWYEETVRYPERHHKLHSAGKVPYGAS